ncbi:MAG: 4Fe-4S dicluster domain-containing protein [Deltaproteobacteria bacterium]|nr:4Fe-4S dicluster domain-containing protein [Deltaproteobacteria bacterium]
MKPVAWIIAYLARWFPHRAPTGLFPLGRPDADSPVLVTANFTLTIKRVRKALAGRSVWLLVTNSEGINVWCAAAGGILTENRVIDAIKVSRLSEKVRRHEVILPPLSAPGVDRKAVRRETGFRCRFGPVYARDIPAYLDAGKKKTEAMRRFDFGWRHRLDMFVPMNLPIYLAVAVVLYLAEPALLPGFTALFWTAVAFLYVFMDWIPGRTGWGQAMLSGLVFAIAQAALDWYSLGNPLAHWGRLLAVLIVFFAAGFDLAGILSPRTSDAERLMSNLGFRRFGSLFVEKETGRVALDRPKCHGCMTCSDICPVGVFNGLDEEKKMLFKDQGACFACGACVKQCPEDALSLIG